MNCHHARQLISPYLDHQLTGREMLALQEHFASCFSCDREMHSIRQVKLLLRGLQEPPTPRNFSGAVALRLQQAEAGPQGWRVLCLPVPKPQRGRRLAAALALSCLTVVSFVAPFAPDAREGAKSSSSVFGSGFGPGLGAVSPSFAASDVGLTGRIPERITWVSVDELTPLPPAASSALPRSNSAALTGLNPAESSLGVTARSQDMPAPDMPAPAPPFDNVQFAVFRPR